MLDGCYRFSFLVIVYLFGLRPGSGLICGWLCFDFVWGSVAVDVFVVVRV